MDGRIPRLWYLPKAWETVSTPRPVTEYLEQLALLQKATSWPPDDCDWKLINSPYIFLSRSPLTFGHSQLVVPSPDDCNEVDLFRLASKIIYYAIATFRSAFGGEKPLHEDKAFESLAENTLTAGPYQKTLVLRASAQEKNETNYTEYKVHLVPYFKSHESLCKKRFQSLHTVIKLDQTGGLLGWLGEREDDVDRWEADSTPMKPLLDEIANQHLGMAGLAKKLRML